MTGPAPTAEKGAWITTIAVDHPLVGTVWNVANAHPIERATMIRDLVPASFVLIGEQHDNPDHHRLQAALVTAMTRAGRRPALAFEMFGTDDQKAIDDFRAAPDHDAKGLGPALGWEKRGWPDWSQYAPIAQVAFDLKSPIVGANIPEALAKAIVHQGPSVLDPKQADALGLTVPLEPGIETEMREELKDAHCGHLPGSFTDAMVLAQRTKDAQMAERMLAADTGPGAVLIAGAGHVRTDRGLVQFLRQKRPQAKIVSIGLVEVADGKDDPGQYAERFHADRLPFDYVLFTPRASNEDPCAKFTKKP